MFEHLISGSYTCVRIYLFSPNSACISWSTIPYIPDQQHLLIINLSHTSLVGSFISGRIPAITLYLCQTNTGLCTVNESHKQFLECFQLSDTYSMSLLWVKFSQKPDCNTTFWCWTFHEISLTIGSSTAMGGVVNLMGVADVNNILLLYSTVELAIVFRLWSRHAFCLWEKHPNHTTHTTHTPL